VPILLFSLFQILKQKKEPIINERLFSVLKTRFPFSRARDYFFPSNLSLSACKASLASPKVGFDSAA
jgi:hypothetical protein